MFSSKVTLVYLVRCVGLWDMLLSYGRSCKSVIECLFSRLRFVSKEQPCKSQVLEGKEMQDWVTYCKLRATSANNSYKKESRFFREIHGKACSKEVKLKSNYAKHHETSDTYISVRTWMKS